MDGEGAVKTHLAGRETLITIDIVKYLMHAVQWPNCHWLCRCQVMESSLVTFLSRRLARSHARQGCLIVGLVLLDLTLFRSNQHH